MNKSSALFPKPLDVLRKSRKKVPVQSAPQSTLNTFGRKITPPSAKMVAKSELTSKISVAALRKHILQTPAHLFTLLKKGDSSSQKAEAARESDLAAESEHASRVSLTTLESPKLESPANAFSLLRKKRPVERPVERSSAPEASSSKMTLTSLETHVLQSPHTTFSLLKAKQPQELEKSEEPSDQPHVETAPLIDEGDVYARLFRALFKIKSQTAMELSNLCAELEMRTHTIERILQLNGEMIKAKEGPVDFSQNESMKKLVDSLRESGFVELPAGKYVWTAEEKEGLKQQLGFAKERLDRMSQEIQFKLQQSTTEDNTVWETISMVFKRLSQAIETIISNIK